MSPPIVSSEIFSLETRSAVSKRERVCMDVDSAKILGVGERRVAEVLCKSWHNRILKCCDVIR